MVFQVRRQQEMLILQYCEVQAYSALVALSNVWFLTFLTVMKPHSSADQRNLAVISDFAITFTMLLGLTLKTVEDTGDYSTLYAMLLVGVNVIVVLYALRFLC